MPYFEEDSRHEQAKIERVFNLIRLLKERKRTVPLILGLHKHIWVVQPKALKTYLNDIVTRMKY